MQQLAQTFGIRGTPTVFLNGVRLGNYNDAGLIQAIRDVTEAKPGAASVIERRVAALRK